MSSSSVVKTKATWTPVTHKIFLDLCIEQAVKGRKYTKEGWRAIVESFNKKTGLRYDKKQLKNHRDATGKQWKAWGKLISCGAMKWDPGTNTFGATDDDWNNYVQVNPEAAPFRFKELEHVEKLELIFGEKIYIEEEGIVAQSNGQNANLTTFLGNESPLDVKPERVIASEQSMSTSSLVKGKATWTTTFHDIFIDICLEETLKGNKHGTIFNKDGWMNITNSFNKTTRAKYDTMQMKNHWDFTKQQWKAWCKLIGTDYMKWNQDARTFDATEDEWMNYTKANPEAAVFRHKELDNADKLEIMFDAITSTGETDPPTRRRRLNDNSRTPIHLLNEPTVNITNQCKKIEHYLSDAAVESRSGVIVHRTCAPIQSIPSKLSYSIGECIECLDGMDEVDQGSDIYLFALDVFLKKEYREIFLQLKKHSVRIAWLQRLQSVGPSN